MIKRHLLPLFCFSILLVSISMGMSGCGGGSSSGGGNSIDPDAPVLQKIETNPNSAPAGSIVSLLQVSLTFTDRNGILGGGSAHYIYDGKEYSIPINIYYTLIKFKAGTIILTGTNLQLNSTIGTVSIPCWLINNEGKKSNIYNYNFNQT